MSKQGPMAVGNRSACAQEGPIDVARLITETQRVRRAGDHFTMVWWLPSALFAAIAAPGPVSPADEARLSVLSELDDYLIFAVLHLQVLPCALPAPSSLEQLLDHSVLEVDGHVVAPLEEATLPPFVRGLIEGLKPGLLQSAGPFAKDTQIVVYPGKGVELRDPHAKSVFTFSVHQEQFAWHLPLASQRHQTIDRRPFSPAVAVSPP